MLYSTIRKKSSAAFMLSPGSFGICVGGFLADKVSLSQKMTSLKKGDSK